jgi:hypothetical protein
MEHANSSPIKGQEDLALALFRFAVVTSVWGGQFRQVFSADLMDRCNLGSAAAQEAGVMKDTTHQQTDTMNMNKISPLAEAPSLPDARPHSDLFRCGGREAISLQ